jgi:hypothetical protein
MTADLRRVGLIAVLALGCLAPERAGGSAGVLSEPVPDFTPPRQALPPDGGRFADVSPPTESPQCFKSGVLPPGCDPTGEWRLTHGQPDSPCPFGASQHVIRLFAGDGLLCLQPVDDFQFLAPGPAGSCAVELSGTHPVPAAAEPYTETWTSWLTFSGAGGRGETQVVVSGSNNCMRKFQTTIDRK